MSLPNNYTANTPQGSQQINNTQQPINSNFQDIADLLAINHVPFNTADDFGKHNFLNMVTQSSDPTTASAEMALYTKAVSGDTNDVELFYRYPNNGSVLQLTGSSSSSGSTGSGGGLFNTLFPSSQQGQQGYPITGSWQYLSNGILMMTWQVSNGYTTATATSPLTVYFPSPTYNYTTLGSSTMPQFTTAVYNLQMAATTSNQANTSISSQTNNGITIIDNQHALLYWTGGATTGAQGAVMITAIGF